MISKDIPDTNVSLRLSEGLRIVGDKVPFEGDIVIDTNVVLAAGFVLPLALEHYKMGK